MAEKLNAGGSPAGSVSHQHQRQLVPFDGHEPAVTSADKRFGGMDVENQAVNEGRGFLSTPLRKQQPRTPGFS